MTMLSAAFKASAALASRAESAGADVVESTQSLTRVTARIADVDPNTQGLMPLADAARALGLRNWKPPLWVGGCHRFAYSGEWMGFNAEIYAYGATTVPSVPTPPGDPLAVEGVAA